jgi:hypothetical protein
MITEIIKRSVDKAGITGKLSNALEDFSEVFRENSYVVYNVVDNPAYEELERHYPPAEILAQSIMHGIQSELIVVNRGKWMWNIGSLVWKLSWLLWTRFKL